MIAIYSCDFLTHTVSGFWNLVRSTLTKPERERRERDLQGSSSIKVQGSLLLDDTYLFVLYHIYTHTQSYETIHYGTEQQFSTSTGIRYILPNIHVLPYMIVQVRYKYDVGTYQVDLRLMVSKCQRAAYIRVLVMIAYAICTGCIILVPAPWRPVP